MNARVAYVAFAVLLTASLAGCAQPTKSPAAQTGTIDVGLHNTKFIPATVTIKAGSTVRWTNHDDFAHDVTADDRAWQSEGGDGGMMKDAVFTRTFDTPGTFPYYCTAHSAPGGPMSGKVVVVA